MGISDWDDGAPSPRDVEGRLVSLDTEELFAEGDEKIRVISFLYAREESVWKAFGYYEETHEYVTVELRKLNLKAQDTWERLEEDARKTSCGYFGRSGMCAGCPVLAISKMCNVAKSEDIVRRAKALSGLH